MQKIIKKFSHLKIHTQYSICEGTIKIDDLKEYCKKNQIQSIGISDTTNLCGALEFSESISKSGTQPIIGTQINFKYNDNIGLLPLVALNENGYKRIIELSSKYYLESNDLSELSLSINTLLEKPDGIAIFSGTSFGFFGKLFDKGRLEDIDKIYQKIHSVFKNKFYIEIQRHNDLNEKNFEEFNLELSHKFDIPLIATQEVFYLDKTMHEAHDALICIGNKTYINEKNRIKYSNQHYFKTDQEMNDLFSDLPEALENNKNFPYLVNFRPQASEPVLPDISTSEGKKADESLINESNQGLILKFKKIFNIPEKNLNNDKKYLSYKKRLDHELKIILEMKYSSYFLIVSDYIKWAKNNDIPVGPGRGSGAGSLVAWCLSITDVDPIKFNLIFERFLNPNRISMPDFDIDFCE